MVYNLPLFIPIRYFIFATSGNENASASSPLGEKLMETEMSDSNKNPRKSPCTTSLSSRTLLTVRG